MTREEVLKELNELREYCEDTFLKRTRIPYLNALDMAIEALKVEPCEDAISRQAAIDAMYALCNTGETLKENPWRDNPHIDAITDAIEDLPPVNPQGSKMGQFANWVAEEIFDENWEYNKDAFAELACRKLAKLGIVRTKGDEWELVEPQESEEV